MQAPAISILLPVYNAHDTLERAVASIVRQTRPDWELICVDDGSTDGTSGLLTRCAQEERRLVCLSTPHRGLVSALQLGLSHARGQWVARMDADDSAHPERLEVQSAMLEARPELGLVGSLVEFGGDPTGAAGYALHVDWMNGLISPEEIALNRFIESPFAHPSVMFDRALAERFGGYREGEFPEDYELWLRWMDAGVKMAKVPRVLLTWNDPPGRLSRNDQRYAVDAFYRCKAHYLARWLQAHVGADRPLLVWGAGRPTRKRAAYLASEGIHIRGYVDIDPKKIGRSVEGKPVLGPGGLPPPERCFVLGYVAKRGARELARAHLQRRGFAEGRDFLMVA